MMQDRLFSHPQPSPSGSVAFVVQVGEKVESLEVSSLQARRLNMSKVSTIRIIVIRSMVVGGALLI